MLSINRWLRSFSSVRQMSPQFQWLSSEGATSRPNESSLSPLLSEVLRCNSYFDKNVLSNVTELLKEPTKRDGPKLSKAKFIAVVFHNSNDEKTRNLMKWLAEQVEVCKVPILRTEQDLFLKSLSESNELPTIGKCMFKDELVQCYFRNALKCGNYLNIRSLLSAHPDSIPFLDHIEEFLEVVKSLKSENSKLFNEEEVLRMVMEAVIRRNPYFVELEDLKKIEDLSSVCNIGFHDSPSTEKKRTWISQKECDILKRKIDEQVKRTKEGFVKTKEYLEVIEQVKKWKKTEKIGNGETSIVVDSLNFGVGTDPVQWGNISAQYQFVKFATRTPPPKVRDAVMRRFGGNAVYCNKLSADDLIIIRMALEMGPATRMVTNDRYKDHRLAVCQGDMKLLRIWDDFMVDAVYRHNASRIENRRNYNLRISESDDMWTFPLVKNCKDQRREFSFKKVFIAD